MEAGLQTNYSARGRISQNTDDGGRTPNYSGQGKYSHKNDDGG
jgi:hypothetical protein